MGVIVCIWILVSVLMGNFQPNNLALNKKSPVFHPHWTLQQWDKQLYAKSLLTLHWDVLTFKTRCLPFPTDINHVTRLVVLVNLFLLFLAKSSHQSTQTGSDMDMMCYTGRVTLKEASLVTFCISFYISPSQPTILWRTSLPPPGKTVTL